MQLVREKAPFNPFISQIQGDSHVNGFYTSPKVIEEGMNAGMELIYYLVAIGTALSQKLWMKPQVLLTRYWPKGISWPYAATALELIPTLNMSNKQGYSLALLQVPQ